MPDQEGVAPLLKILETLVPADDGVIITDGTGAKHKVAGALPARKQIQTLRALESVKETILQDESIVATFGSPKGGGAESVSDLIDAFVALAANEQVLESVAHAFEIAHPQAVERALGNALEYNSRFVHSDAADLFPVEELIAGLLPFSVRLVKRGAEALGAVTTATQSDQA